MELSANLGRLLLRLTLGGLLLFHGVAKLHTVPLAIMDRIAKAGFPSALGYLVYVGEVLAPLLLILGLWTRLAALLVAVNMVVAVLLAHSAQLGDVGRSGGYALELQAFYLFTALAIALLGGGRFGVGAGGRLN
jgi:putative oxidoreductase